MSAFEGCTQGSVLLRPTQPRLASLAWGSPIPAHLFSKHLSTGLRPRRDSEYPPLPRSLLRVWPQASSSSDRERMFSSLVAGRHPHYVPAGLQFCTCPHGEEGWVVWVPPSGSPGRPAVALTALICHIKDFQKEQAEAVSEFYCFTSPAQAGFLRSPT